MAGDIGIQETAVIFPAGQIADEFDRLGRTGQRLGLAAFDRRCSAEYAAIKAARPHDGESWAVAEAPDLPESDT